LALDTLSIKLAALADPTRRAILQRLSSGEASVTELAAPFRMGMPAITKHLKVLERAGLISRSRSAQWRPCRLQPAALSEVDQWLAYYRQFMDESFDRLGDYLRDLQAQQPPAGDAP
jgi:DNA-binding transcriptional ArsR family regulator